MICERPLHRESLRPERIRLHGQHESVVKVSLGTQSQDAVPSQQLMLA